MRNNKKKAPSGVPRRKAGRGGAGRADGVVILPHQHLLEAIPQFTLTRPLRINLNSISIGSSTILS